MKINRRTLPLSAIRAFESAAKHMHLRRAGDELGVTHGAVSHQIRALEAYLGVQLFSRESNRLKITPEGARLKQAVTEGLDQITASILNLQPDVLAGPLHVACTQTVATCWAIQHIGEFQAAYPTVQLTISEIQPRQRRLPQEIDVALCYGEPIAEGKHVTKIAESSLVPVCSPNLLDKKRLPLKMSDIFDFTLLIDHQETWKSWFSHFDAAPTPMHNRIYFSNTSQALLAARLGQGVALCNDLEASEYIRRGDLIRMMRKPVADKNNYYLVKQSEQNESIRARVFADWMLDAIKEA